MFMQRCNITHILSGIMESRLVHFNGWPYGYGSDLIDLGDIIRLGNVGMQYANIFILIIVFKNSKERKWLTINDKGITLCIMDAVGGTHYI